MSNDSENIPDVDLSIVQGYAETDEELKGYIDIFLDESSKDLALLGQQCTEGENLLWLQIAHKLKGSSAMIGAHCMNKHSKEAQGMVISSIEDRAEKFKEISNAFEIAKKYLENVLRGMDV